MVAPIAAIREGDIGMVSELVTACRAAAPETTLKVILETGVLGEPSLIAGAARAAVMAGCDFLKTSTGKAPVGATLEAAAVLLAVIEEAGGKSGLQGCGRHQDRPAGRILPLSGGAADRPLLGLPEQPSASAHRRCSTICCARCRRALRRPEA